jgi:cytoskeletal protein RodZ
MNTISETLRRERVRQGLDLQKLSESLKISKRMLQAMEAGDFSKLPGGIFTKSFIRQYAATLGIDAAFVNLQLQELPGEFAPPAVKRESEYVPFQPVERKSNSLALAGMWVVLALIGCGGVYYLSKNYSFPSNSKPAESASVSVAAAPQKVVANPVPLSTPAVPAIGNGSLQVVLNASEQSWVSVHVDGKLLFTGILQPNERREIKADETVKVTAGNAGGIDISLNGKALDSLGAKGQVRTVELTRAGAQVVSRTSKSEPLL